MPSCAADDVKQTVAEIAQEHPPRQLIETAINGSVAEKQLEKQLARAIQLDSEQCNTILEKLREEAIAKWHAELGVCDFNKAQREIASGGAQRYADCRRLYEDSLTKPAQCRSEILQKHEAEREAKRDEAKSSATYTIKTIRMIARDDTTEAVSCAADLHVVLPGDWGGAKEPITYKIEKLLDSNGLNVSVDGLQ